MSAFNFPNSPSVNDQYTANGVTFKWNGTIWQRISASSGAQGTTGSAGPTGAQGAAAGLTISTSAPGSPSAGDMWWDSDAGLFLTYYNDGNSSQWVEINQGPKGAQGATGPTGAQGATGPTGAQGAAGAQGATGAAGSNATISNNADNRVITGGSGTNLNGEANLTFDGATLSSNNGSGDGTVKIGGQNTSTGATLFYEISGSTFLRIKNLYRSNASNGNLAYIEYDAGYHKFLSSKNGTEALRINSTGQLLHGHNASIGNGRNFETSSTSGYGGIAINRFSADTGSGGLDFVKSRNASLGGNTIVQSGDNLGVITWRGADGTDFTTPAAQIKVAVDGTPGSNDMPGRIMFYTTADGASTPTERLRIASDGKIYVGGNGASATSGELWFNDTSAYSSKIAQVNGSNALTFHTGSSQPERLRISANVLRFNSTAQQIHLNTADGSDTGYLNIGAAGAGTGNNQTRGAQIVFYGNEASGNQGKLGILAGNSGSSNGFIYFNCNGVEKMRLTQSGALLLQPSTGSIAELSAGGTNTDIRISAVGSGGYFDVATNGSGNRIRVDGNGHFYQNQQRTRLTYGAATACSLRWNITDGKNLTQNNSNRDNYGKVNIQAGRANSTSINDDCVAIRITPAEVRNSAVGTKMSGIGFMHLNADQWPEYSGNQAWMGLSLHSTPGQELSYLETWHNTQTSQGSQPNNVGMRIYPNGNVTAPSSAGFSAQGVNQYSGFPGNGVWKTYRPSSENFDKGNDFDPNTGQFTAPCDGAFFFNVTGLIYPMGATNFGQARWLKNGSIYGDLMQFNGTDGNHRNFSFSIIIYMSNNETAEFQIYRNSGESWTLYTSQFNIGGYLVG